MEVGAHVWLRSDSSQWGWVPAKITHKDEISVNVTKNGETTPQSMVKLTLADDNLNYHRFNGASSPSAATPQTPLGNNQKNQNQRSNSTSSTSSSYNFPVDTYFSTIQPFSVQITVDPNTLKKADHPDIKLRNLPTSFQFSGKDPEAGVISSPNTHITPSVVGGVHDLIGLTHLHEPAILHALRLRYDSDIIYTATGPILIAVNPFKGMEYLYSDEIMESYRVEGERGGGAASSSVMKNSVTPYKGGRKHQGGATEEKLPPHAYKIADEAYRAMMRGLENWILMNQKGGSMSRGNIKRKSSNIDAVVPTNQSILVSGESGAGKTVTTKIVLNYFAMLSKKISDDEYLQRSSSKHKHGDGLSKRFSPRANALYSPSSFDDEEEQVCIEQQVLQSNPILEAFGNARTLRNDNSSRFGKFIDIQFTSKGKLSGAKIETYLLEKVRLIHPSVGERNYHIFYQFLAGASGQEYSMYDLEGMTVDDFHLLNQTGTCDRRDGVMDGEMHADMLDAMVTIGFTDETIQALMRLMMAILHCGNIQFTATHEANTRGMSDACTMERTHSSVAAARLLGVTFEDLSDALTYRAIKAGNEVVHSPLDKVQSEKACEALMKATYGAAFDFIVNKVNESISNEQVPHDSCGASIGVLDIFGFESFETNNFEQICINYTNEALQQQFNKYVFKLEQDEYEREGILWKFISFPDNQDVLDLIDRKHTGILALLDEQCIVPRSTDEKFTRYLYAKCDKDTRFSATSAQRVDYKFSIEHYAGPVEYSTDNWLEKNKDQLPASSANLLKETDFDLVAHIRQYIRSEGKEGRGSVATKSVGAQFSTQLTQLRSRIDTTVPHYIRCLKPNDELVPDSFDPRRIVDQLRCGGVLEAVRVSRAGYPTRYPHEVFKARYYILGDPNDKSIASPIKKWGRASLSEEDSQVKKLVSKIAFDIWEADHEAMLIALEEEGELARSKIRSPDAKYINGHMNLVSVSSVKTPPEQRRAKALLKKRRESTSTALYAKSTSEIARPQTAAEFLSLDFSSRCAIAGLQLGKTKVFLRREAFDQIEHLRAQKFGKSAIEIQRVIRGVQARRYCRFLREQKIWAACVIQRAYRNHLHYLHYLKVQATLVPAAIRIQAVARGANTRMWFFGTLYSIMRLQAMVRGCQARAHVASLLEEKRQPVSSPVHSIAHHSLGQNTFEEDEEVPVNTVDMNHDMSQLVPVNETQAVVEVTSEWVQLCNYVKDENWVAVEQTIDQFPHLAEEVDPANGEMLLHMLCRHPNVWSLLVDMVVVLYAKALIHKDAIGALPLHHAAAHDNVAALEIVFSAYKEGVNDVDVEGRQPLHVAAEFDAVEGVKFLLEKAPEGAYTMIHRPKGDSGGGLPLHVACRHHSNLSIITGLLAENFSSCKRSDENGDLPLHLLLRNGEAVEQVTVKTILTCFAAAASRTDKNGDLPLAIALKSECNQSVVNYLLMQYPDAAKVLDSNGHTNLHLALQHGADDRTMLGLLNHAPELATHIDKESGMLPIQMATEHEHSHFIVNHLLKQDMPIDIKDKVKGNAQKHKFSWNHVVSNTDDMYFPVISKILQQCTQPQVLALAHVEGPDGRIALSTATPVCKHEMRVMLRLFNTLEVVNQRPAFSNPESDTQIFYALRYDPPKQSSSQWNLIHEDNKKEGDYLEEWDDASHVSGLSRVSSRSHNSMLSKSSQVNINERMKQIKKEKGQQVIAKLTSRSDVVERELKIRKDFQLSRHYIPAVISVHHTVQHAAYSEAMAEPGYCITMEGADTTAENLMLDMRKHGKSFSGKILRKIGASLLHMHEHGLVHCDFGTHNVGKFGNRWKLLGVGGSKAIGSPTDPKRGFYHPPEAVVVETRRAPLGKKELVAKVVSIKARPSHDIWAFGVLMYEAICGVPLSPYACRGKRVMNANEIAKVGRWDEVSLERALRHVDPSDHNSLNILRKLLHPSLQERYSTLREALDHPFFSGSLDDRVLSKQKEPDAQPSRKALPPTQTRQVNSTRRTRKNGVSEGLEALDHESENANNGQNGTRRENKKGIAGGLGGLGNMSVMSKMSASSKMSRGLKGLRSKVGIKHEC